MSVSARETAGSPRDLLPGGRPRGGVPVRLPFAKRWCPKVDGIDFGTLSYPLNCGQGHRVFEGDNVRLLRSDSGDASGGVARCPRPRPRARPTKCRAATTTHVRRWISSGKKHRKTPKTRDFTLAKPGKNVQEVVEIAWGSLKCARSESRATRSRKNEAKIRTRHHS